MLSCRIFGQNFIQVDKSFILLLHWFITRRQCNNKENFCQRRSGHASGRFFSNCGRIRKFQSVDARRKEEKEKASVADGKKARIRAKSKERRKCPVGRMFWYKNSGKEKYPEITTRHVIRKSFVNTNFSERNTRRKNTEKKESEIDEEGASELSRTQTCLEPMFPVETFQNS